MKLCEYCLKPMSEFEQGNTCKKCKKWVAEEKRKEKAKKPCSITDVMRELDEYNKKHGTRLSYGQYMTLTSGEK